MRAWPRVWRASIGQKRHWTHNRSTSTRQFGDRRLTISSLLGDRDVNSKDESENGRVSPSVGQTCQINAYVKTIRKQKKVAFAALQDGSCLDTVQAVLSPKLAERLSTGASVRVEGTLKKSPPGKEQAYELQVTGVEVLGENDAQTNPLQKKYQTSQFLRTIPHLRARLPQNAVLLRLRSQVIAALSRYFANEDFVQTHTPIITSSDCEGAGEVFTISSNASKSSGQKAPEGKAPAVEHFFKDPKYLTVSAQLHLEALAQSVGKVWTLSPTFRAEKSDTPRHLSEFYMLEAEVAFESDMDRVMDVVENMLHYVARELHDSQTTSELMDVVEKREKQSEEGHAQEAAVTRETLQQRWQGLLTQNWPRIKYEEAIEKLQQAVDAGTITFEHAVSYDEGLQAEHERFLASTIGKGSPIFVTHYPRNQKPFYMTPSSTNSKDTVECFDLLVPDLCELAGGSMREHRSKQLLDTMQGQGIDAGTLQWYIDLRRFGSVPHGGFGLGFDRLISYLSGVSNIRDVVAFPRHYGRCDA